MLKDDELVGAITIYRQEVRPFTDKQIELVTNFAAQAVIAIENARLLSELRSAPRSHRVAGAADRDQRGAEGHLQFAGELEPVFQAMLENAARICDAKFGTLFLYEDQRFPPRDLHGAPPGFADFGGANRSFDPGPGTALAASSRQADSPCRRPAAESRMPALACASVGRGSHGPHAVPMLKDNELVGAITIYRQEVRPFTDKQIELVQNFAAQAVIAIENTRLLNELRQRTDDLTESLEQQTATSEVLSVISSSQGELGPVFRAMLENATRICGAKFGNLFLREGDVYRAVAVHGEPSYCAYWQRDPLLDVSEDPELPMARVTSSKSVVHIADLAAEGTFNRGNARIVALVKSAGARTFLAVPMLKDNELIGSIAMYRQEVRPFAGKQIDLVKNFAAQAVIAIENTRLLNELRQRTDDLSESLEQQTATSEVLKVISSSPGELEPVFQAMLENATRICEAKFGCCSFAMATASVRLRCMACHRATVQSALGQSCHPPPRHSAARVAANASGSIHIADIESDRRVMPAVSAVNVGGRSHVLAVPMLKDDELVGAIQHLPPGGASLHRQADRAGDRTSPRRPSSPSRTRGCSTSCASAPTISPSRWSSRPRRPRC